MRIHEFFLFHIPWFTFSTQKRWALGDIVRIHDFFLLHIPRTTFSTQKRRNLGGVVRIHDFLYSEFTGSHFQLKNGGFRRYGANSRLLRFIQNGVLHFYDNQLSHVPTHV